MKVITKNNIIIAISNNAQWVENGIKIDDCIIGVSKENNIFVSGYNIYNVDTLPQEIEPQKYCYDGNFTLNPDYVEPINEQIAILKTQINDLNIAMANLIGM